MARLVFDERENQQLGAPLFQFAVEHARLHILHSDILCRCMSGVSTRPCRLPSTVDYALTRPPYRSSYNVSECPWTMRSSSAACPRSVPAFSRPLRWPM